MRMNAFKESAEYIVEGHISETGDIKDIMLIDLTQQATIS